MDIIHKQQPCLLKSLITIDKQLKINEEKKLMRKKRLCVWKNYTNRKRTVATKREILSLAESNNFQEKLK